MTHQNRPQHHKNLLPKEAALAKLQAEDFARTTLSFYRYVIIERDLWELRDELFVAWEKLGVLGRIYLAREGVNAQLSVPTAQLAAFTEQLHSNPEFAAVPFKIAVEDDGKSFWKLTVKVRKRIVADGLADDDYDVTRVGTHLDAAGFNALLDDDAAIVVDMRNKYESDIGHFEGAVCPSAQTFKDELPEVLALLGEDKTRPVGLYCTGGIRCEKASAFLRHHGFANVSQLHGGVIAYAHEVKAKSLPNRFRGKNFVFDGRGAEALSDDVLTQCTGCGVACDEYVDVLTAGGGQELRVQCPECTVELGNRFPEKWRGRAGV